jgi:hypothetical protein
MKTLIELKKEKEKIERSIEGIEFQIEEMYRDIDRLEDKLYKVVEQINLLTKIGQSDLSYMLREFIDNHSKDVSWATIEAAEKFIRSEVISRIGGKNILRQQMRQFGYPINF